MKPNKTAPIIKAIIFDRFICNFSIKATNFGLKGSLIEQVSLHVLMHSANVPTCNIDWL